MTVLLMWPNPYYSPDDITAEAIPAVVAIPTPVETVAIPLDEHIEQVVEDATEPVLDAQREELRNAHERINDLESKLVEFNEWRMTLENPNQAVNQEMEQVTPEAVSAVEGHQEPVTEVEVAPIAPPEQEQKQTSKKGIWLQHPIKKMRQS